MDLCAQGASLTSLIPLQIVTRFVPQARAPQQQAPESASSPDYSHYELTPAPAGRLASFSSMSGARARAARCGLCGSVAVVGVCFL